MDDEEAEESTRSLFRRDLEVTATAAQAGEQSFVVDAALRSLDRFTMFEPTLVFTPSASVQIVDLPNGCTRQGPTVECVLAAYFDQGDTRDDRLVPTDWLPLTLSATIDADAPEPYEITITAVSEQNGLDNDPDPTNNTVTLELIP